MAMNGPQNSTEEVVAETTVEVPAPKKQVASKTHQQTLAEFKKSKSLPKDEFRAKNKSEMEGWRSNFEAAASDMQIDREPLTEYQWKTAQLPKTGAPEGFQPQQKAFDEIAENLFKEFGKLNIVDPFAPTEPTKPVVEKTETQTSGWTTSLWGAAKSPAEVEYDSKMEAFKKDKKAFDSQKKAYDARREDVTKLKSALNSALETAQSKLEKLVTFEPGVPSKTIQAELGLSTFKDKEKGIVSQFLGNKWGRNNFVKTIEEERARALEAQKQSSLRLAVQARTPVAEELVEEEMEAARERRNALKVK